MCPLTGGLSLTGVDYLSGAKKDVNVLLASGKYERRHDYEWGILGLPPTFFK